ncbi:MAG: hypothetical protein IT445_18450 [Phycisphaeraceae bacterium]|nr:hypothetical protein [Phycisphaeraceae bacterium]
MRLVIDSLIALMMVSLLGTVLWAHQRQQQQDLSRQMLCDALARLHQQTVYHGALGDVDLSDNGFPQQVMPDWFGQQFPCNTLTDARRPWIDVAPPGDMADQPPDPVLTEEQQAAFWYNPNRGLFRARVPAQVNDRQTLALYNQINQCALHELPLISDETRQPIAHAPLPTAAVAKAPRGNAAMSETVSEAMPEAPPTPARPSLRDLD